MSLLALLALAVVATTLTISLVYPVVERSRRARRRHPRRRRDELVEVRDPGRERRAEGRARELLRSCVNEEEWAMYRDLGFIRVWGGMARREGPPGTGRSRPHDWAGSNAAGWSRFGERAAADDEAPYAYLIYPHKPILAYIPRTRELLNEYCVEFPDLTTSISQSRLPDSDDVLAKWMALTGDERRLIRNANMHLPGRQIDPSRVRRDLWRLAEWERERSDRDPRDPLERL